MNDTQISLEAGRSRTYMAAVKVNSPDKYKLLKKYGILGYEARIIQFRHKLSEIHFYLKEHTTIQWFYDNHVSDLFPSYATLDVFLNTHAYSLVPYMHMRTYKKCKDLFERFENVRIKNTRQDT